MHILYLHQYYCPVGGSGNTRSRTFADQWSRAGNQVTVLTSPAYFPEPMRTEALRNTEYQFSTDAGTRVISLGVDYNHLMPFRQRIVAFERFRSRVATWLSRCSPPDVIYASSTPIQMGWTGRKAAHRFKVPFVYECVDVWPDVPEGMGIIRNPILLKWLHHKTNQVYRDASAIVALSPGMKSQIVSHGSWEPKTHVIFNGTEPSLFPYIERYRESGPVRLLYLGTIGKANDVAQLVHALQSPLLQSADVHLDIVGDGNDANAVRMLAEGNPKITFHGRVPKEAAGKFLEQADIGVVTFAPFPVLEANSANKWYDYLSSGLPVITNYRGWQADFMKQYNCGLSCAQGDINGLASALATLASHPELRRQMGQNGARLAREQFDRTRLAHQTLQILCSVTNQ